MRVLLHSLRDSDDVVVALKPAEDSWDPGARLRDARVPLFDQVSVVGRRVCTRTGVRRRGRLLGKSRTCLPAGSRPSHPPPPLTWSTTPPSGEGTGGGWGGAGGPSLSSTSHRSVSPGPRSPPHSSPPPSTTEGRSRSTPRPGSSVLRRDFSFGLWHVSRHVGCLVKGVRDTVSRRVVEDTPSVVSSPKRTPPFVPDTGVVGVYVPIRGRGWVARDSG